ncbi:hypothetical protein BASA83_013236 [Batrachochytrium salamandrivorans]|nr:hypothetical protein BASA83_013236 [Batrachochytrium salamandrivorans]
MWYYACGPHTGTTVKATILSVEQSIGNSSSRNSRSNPITPSSHPSSPISHQVPFLYADILVLQLHPSSPLSTSSSIYIPSSPHPHQFYSLPLATPTQDPAHHPIQLHGIDLPSVSQYEYLGVIIDDLLTLSPLVVNEEARLLQPLCTRISPLLRNNFLYTRRSRSLIRFVHPNMSLFHFNIPISTNGLFHNPISTNPPITSSNINRSIQNTPSINTSNTTTSTTIPITPTISEIRHQRSKYAFERTFQVWGKSKLACSYVQATTRQVQIFALAGPQYWPGHRSLSPLTGPLWWPMGLP